MTKNVKRFFSLAAICLVLFCCLAVMLKTLDVQAIGPEGSKIGLATLNAAYRDAVGTSDTLYKISELLGLLSLAAVAFLGALAGLQLICRKSFKKVDGDLYVLGLLYVLTLVAYVLFEICIINYRPVLVDGVLEAAFPSSHTVLALTVSLSAAEQAWRRIRQKQLRVALPLALLVIGAATAVGRALSGVHWLTDILGGLLLALSLLLFYLGGIAWLAAKKAEV